MTKQSFGQIGERLKDERQRIGVGQVSLADSCDISRSTLATWEKGDQSPSATALGVMAGLGIDVLYVITGNRAGQSEMTLAPAERDLLSAWRQADAKGRALLAAAADVLKPE